MSHDEQQLTDALARVVLVLADASSTNEQRLAAVTRMTDATHNDADIFCAFWSLTVAAVTALRHTHGIPAGEHFSLVLAEFDRQGGKVVDAGDAPPRFAVLGRWMTAAGNHDLDIALALFKSIPVDENLSHFGEDVIRACGQLLQAAGRKAAS